MTVRDLSTYSESQSRVLACKLLSVPLRLAFDESISPCVLRSESEKYVSAIFIHSFPNTPNRSNGPMRLVSSRFGAVAFEGFHSGSFVMAIAIGFTEIKASSPLNTPRQLASAPPRPSGRAKFTLKHKSLMTLPRTSGNVPSESNRREMSCRN